MTKLRTIGGPCPGIKVDVGDYHTIVFHYWSSINGQTFMVHYDVTPEGLIWRSWLRAQARRSPKSLSIA